MDLMLTGDKVIDKCLINLDKRISNLNIPGAPVINIYDPLAVTADYTFVNTDLVNIAYVTTGASDITITIPSDINRQVSIMKVDSGAGKVIVSGSINGVSSINIALQYQGISVSSIGSALVITGTIGGCEQVLQVLKTDTFETNSTSFIDITDLSITVNPRSTNSKFLIRAVVNATKNALNTSGFLQLVRDSTPIAIGNSANNRRRCSCEVRCYADNQIESYTIEYLDSPSTISPIVYKIQGCSESSGNYLEINRTQADTDNIAFGRSASTFTIKEIFI